MGNCIQGARHDVLAPAVPGDQAGPAGAHAQQPSQPAERLPSRVAASGAQGPAAGLPVRPPRPDAAAAASGEPPMALPSSGHPAAENVLYATPIFDLHMLPELPFAEATSDLNMLPELPEPYANLPNLVDLSELISLAPPPTRSRGDEIGTSRPALGAARLRSQDLPASAENRTSPQEATASLVVTNPQEIAAGIIDLFDGLFPSYVAIHSEQNLGIRNEMRRALATNLETIDDMIVEVSESPALADSVRSRLQEIRRAISVHMAAMRPGEG
jgi:hypothetical protein